MASVFDLSLARSFELALFHALLAERGSSRTSELSRLAKVLEPLCGRQASQRFLERWLA